jgi:putative transposase
MSRSTRVVIPGFAHHIITRGNNRRTIFSYPRDYLKFMTHVGKALETSQCRLHAMTLMRNHVHCIATPACQNDLSIFVKRFSQRYAMYRNKQRGGSGKLFQDRYYSKPIQDERYLAIAQIYIELNAWRAGMVTDPLDYPWSTFPIHAGHPDRSKIPMELWTPSPWYLALGRSDEARAQRYTTLTRQICLEGSRPCPDEEIENCEELSREPDRKRVERPDRSTAR